MLHIFIFNTFNENYFWIVSIWTLPQYNLAITTVKDITKTRTGILVFFFFPFSFLSARRDHLSSAPRFIWRIKRFQCFLNTGLNEVIMTRSKKLAQAKMGGVSVSSLTTTAQYIKLSTCFFDWQNQTDGVCSHLGHMLLRNNMGTYFPIHISLLALSL